MLIECKKANSNLTVKNFEQLSAIKNHKDSKIGILTNGIVYDSIQSSGTMIKF